MSFRARSTLALTAEENDRLAKEIDPSGFCYAVLQVLRLGESYSEIDFQALCAQGKAGGLRRVQPQEVVAEVRQLSELPEPVTVRRRRKPGPPPVGPTGIRYAGTEDEDEAIAEARRVGALEGQEDVYGDGQGEDGDEWEEAPARRSRTPKQASPNTITLTPAQLQGMLAEASRRAILQVTPPAPAEAPPVGADEDADAEPEYDTGADLAEEPPAPDQVADAEQADQDERERDGSGRFVPTQSRSKR